MLAGRPGSHLGRCLDSERSPSTRLVLGVSCVALYMCIATGVKGMYVLGGCKCSLPNFSNSG